ncbi:MAG: TerB family tellurite resistance protein [Deltaproteobacteria bacterium]|nr:TerB family tellurite resistance protein [Deltaproteobacteria bacterium]
MGFFSRKSKLGKIPAHEVEYVRPSEEERILEKKRRTNFVSTFSLLAKLTKADGRISSGEIEAVNKLIDEQLQLSEKQKELAVSIFNKAKNSSENIESIAAAYRDNNIDSPSMYRWLIEVMLNVASADKQFCAAEQELIDRVRKLLGIEDSVYLELLARYQEEKITCYQRLGCSPSDTAETIKKKYLELKASYSSERLKDLAVPEEFIKLAQEKLKQIEDAYQEISNLQHIS